MDKLNVLQTANNNLSLLYPGKHKPIELNEIEKVYDRCVLGFNADAKTVKGLKQGYLTGIMYLAPANLSGINMCPKASEGCKAACLFSAGRGRFYAISRARIIKTLAFTFDKPRFTATIKKSIKSLLTKAKNKGLIPVCRLNGTSDILWELNTDIIQSYPDLQFYDYTKIAKRFIFPLPKNYHLTFSLSETNEDDARQVLANGHNVAAVFRTDVYPTEYLGNRVTSGDNTDLRFLDDKGTIIALKAKGKAKKDTSGFVKDIS